MGDDAIGVGWLDLFASKDVEYARRLQEAAVGGGIEVVDEAFHGFDVIRPRARVSRAFRRSQIEALAGAPLTTWIGPTRGNATNTMALAQP